MARYLLTLSALAILTQAQQQCYFGPGAENRGPSELVPCMASGQSSCCLLGDVCLSGSTCWNFDTGNLYQYGCTDINYEDESCPYKCGSNSSEYPAQNRQLTTTDIKSTQPCRHGRLSSIVWTNLEKSTTPGSVTTRKAAAASGIPVQRCSYSNLEDVKTWARTPRSLYTLHPRSRRIYPCQPVSVEALDTSPRRRSTVLVLGYLP
jgi:hypothetical protein